MHPGYMYRAPVSVSTPLPARLTFPGCVTLGKSLPLSEPKVPLLEVKIVKQTPLLSFCHLGSVVTLQKCRHTAPQGLCVHYFVCLDPLLPDVCPCILAHSLPCSPRIHSSRYCCWLDGFAYMSLPLGQLHFGFSCSLSHLLHF